MLEHPKHPTWLRHWILPSTSSKAPSHVQSTLTVDLENIASWIDKNYLKMNVSKTQLMTLRRKRSKPPADISLQLRGNDIASHYSIKYLGITVDRDLNWKQHNITDVHRKTLAAVATIGRARGYLPVKTRKLLYNALVLPHMDYCSGVWNSCSTNLS